MHNLLTTQTWHGGQLMAFSGLEGTTSYHQGLVARTAFDAPGLNIMLPAAAQIRFPETVGSAYAVAGDWLQIDGQQKVLAVWLDTYHLLIEGPCVITARDSGVVSLQKQQRTLLGPVTHFQPEKISADIQTALQNRQSWLSRINLPESQTTSSPSTLAKALSIMKTQVYSPEGNIRHYWTTPDRWPHRNMWLWDSAFHAIGWRHIAPEMARAILQAVFDQQAADGFVPHMMTPAEVSTITQPPVLALGAKLVYEAHADQAWLQALYPCLAKYLEWDLKHRDTDGDGLLEWYIEGDPYCRCGESGMDNSPRFDMATQLAAVDFNAYISLECRIMADFARILGRDNDASIWMERHAKLNQLISQRLWSDDQRFFIDYDVKRQTHSPVLASSGFLPLLCGAATAEQAQRLSECLTALDMFGTALPVPSVAVRSDQPYSDDMWRGPVWINLNWLIIRGLKNYGLHGLARNLKNQTMAAIELAHATHGVLYEYYDAHQKTAPAKLERKGKCAPEISPYHQVFHDYGWTATLYVDLACSRDPLRKSQQAESVPSA